MATRTKEMTVSFPYPFSLSALDQEQPAGRYRVVIDEEDIPNISFLAYRRVATMLHTPAVDVQGKSQVFMVNYDELMQALAADEGK
ncbi:hypothetical protein DFO45_3091 [Azorhizobium sp. AG788]|uniref:hypothetical protein n=1 Tax=Azorhizobium sp. AG788 TaxID=2183897 RepID=UPI00105FA2BF|nr:hypothetical protein [Azorhizobium sp. AG788]TDT93709.1 hypothetical protein DFO45_3091 [Azorhizobium sp. AG788]